MFPDEPRQETDDLSLGEAVSRIESTIDSPIKSAAAPNEPADAYFDRERWRAVGDDLERVPDRDSPDYRRAAGFSSFSIAVLGIVTLFAGLLGVLAVHYLPTIQFQHGPLRRNFDFRTIPAQWIGYTQTLVFPVSAPNPSCFCVHPNGNLLIGGDRQLFVFSEHGNELGVFPLTGNPHCMVVAGQKTPLSGKLLVAYRNHVEVYLLNESFYPTLTATWPVLEGNPNLCSITLAQDAVYLGDSGERLVYKCGFNGAVLKRIGQTEPSAHSATSGKSPAVSQDVSNPGTASSDSGSLPHSSSKGSASASSSPEETGTDIFKGFASAIHPSLSVSVSPKSGLVYVTNPGEHRVEAFSPDGTWNSRLSWGDESTGFTGFCACCNPVEIVVLDDGNILTVEKLINRIKIYDTHGKLKTVVADPDILDRMPQSLLEKGQRDIRRYAISESASRPVFVAIHDQRVFVLDPIFQLVRYFEPNDFSAAKPPLPSESPENAD